jgi:flavorubredoxin/flavin reductase (DIM6/NTAB) family NADH-FMN oxidoreductase RutF
LFCVKKITQDIDWIGVNDRRLAMFEGVYSVPEGVSYNSYLLKDEMTVLFDTVDKAVSQTFLENLNQSLGGRKLDYVVVQHVEPDHSATLRELLAHYPEVTVVCNEKIRDMLIRFYNFDLTERAYIVKEGSILNSGKHELTFVMAPMVHWPEVMVTYDKTDKILFSADAFGSFGALNGAIFADEMISRERYFDEARRYYTNIVGKYGNQVQALLKKASALDISMICPLHGYVWRSKISEIIDKYQLWSTYTPEEKGVMIAYASIYGNTENCAEIISSRLREKGIKTVMFDVSVTPPSEIVAAAFRWSHLVFASPTYNAGIFVQMEDLLHEIAAHNLSNRKVALIENGSWAPTSGQLMREILEKCKNISFFDPMITIKSALSPSQSEQIDLLVNAIYDDIGVAKPSESHTAGNIDSNSLFKLSYGLFVLTARQGNKDNGCIINTVQQLTSNSPQLITISVNKQNYTHDMIIESGIFNVSVLSEEAPFKVFERFGFKSGRDTDKFADCNEEKRTSNGVLYVPKYTNAVLSGKVVQSIDCGTHTLFVAELTEAIKLSDVKSMTYEYYFANVKPKPQVNSETKKGFVCKICGYVYEGEELPEDYICPLCKHGAEDFEPIS